MSDLPLISLIWAMARNRTIGIDNRLPWHLPADLQRFKALTTGHTIVMGRKTFESFPRPLPNRRHVIVTTQKNYAPPANGVVVPSIDAALTARPGNEDEIFVIGGASIYAQTLARADRLYVTLVAAEVVGDASFPPFDWGDWRELSREDCPADARHRFAYSFVTLERHIPHRESD